MMSSSTYAELFPGGRTIFYEGSDPEGFAEQIKAEFGFDPRESPGVYENQPVPYDYWALSQMPAEAKRPTWSQEHDWQFHCPSEHLDAVYGTRRWPLGS
jgi:hypothetical protein